uniref:A to I editase domain-containing protein n=2 Tax=Salvator merianae TaxID=96440 RepID=A0A8D0CAM6_SALMN
MPNEGEKARKDGQKIKLVASLDRNEAEAARKGQHLPASSFCAVSKSSANAANGKGSPAPQVSSVEPLTVEGGVSHAERCAAVTAARCEMLLRENAQFQDCMSSVAAFVLEKEVADSQSPYKETYELVALGTGDVTYNGWMEFSGRRLHDMHGMVVARRALVRYLYKQLLLYCSEDPAAQERCVFCAAEDGQHLRLKPNCFLHLYLRQKPSGPSDNFQTAPLPASSSSMGIQVVIQGALKPLLYCRPSKLRSHVYSASGSDKLTRWSVLGVQGALLSHIIHPVYITSIVIDGAYQDLDALSCVISGRLKQGCWQGLPGGYGRKEVHLFKGPCTPSLEPSPEHLLLSFNWSGGDQSLELVNGAVGQAVPDFANPSLDYRPCRLCKVAMLKYFRMVAKEMKRDDLMSLPTYHEAKVRAESYQAAKHHLYAQMSLHEFGKWPQKQLVDIFPG